MVFTKEKINQILEAGKSIRGAWSRKQLEVILTAHEFTGLGTWSIQKGWKDRLVGKEISQEQIDKFISLKNKHLSKEKIKLAKKEREEDYKALFAGTDNYNCETCFHYKACKRAWDKSTCCGYWYHPDSEIQGIAYRHEEEQMPLFN